MCTLGGIGKFTDRIEDLPATLDAATRANANTILDGPTTWLAARPRVVAVATGVPMVATGIAQLLDRGPTAMRSTIQLGLLASFSVFLHRAYRQVTAVDLVFAAAILGTGFLRPKSN